MSLVLKDRVRETTTTTGTGAIALDGTLPGFQAFVEVGDGNQTYYVVEHPAEGDWEVGLGTYSAAGNTLSRDEVYDSSNGGALVDFAAGEKRVFVSYPALVANARLTDFFTATISTNDWSGAGPYIAVKTVVGLKSTDRFVFDVDLSAVSFGNVTDVLDNWVFVYRAESSADDELTVYAYEEPQTSFTVTLQVIR